MTTLTYTDEEKSQIQNLKTIIRLRVRWGAAGIDYWNWGEAYAKGWDSLEQRFEERKERAIEYVNETDKMLEVFVKEEIRAVERVLGE